MTDINFDHLPQYEKMIETHHHDLEGIYIGIYNSDINKLEYTDLITVDDIKFNTYSKKDLINNVVLNYDTSINIYLSEQESRMFDIMTSTMTNFKNDEQSTYFLEIKNTSEKNIEFMKKHYTNNIVLSGGKPLGSDPDNYQIIVYKYIDPVIRMCCEYAILFDQYVKRHGNNLNLFLDEDSNIDDFKINCWLQFVWEENRTVKDISGIEGNICVFGVGRIDCCSHTLNNEHLSQLRINQSIFNLTAYNTTISSEATYKSTPPLDDLFQLQLGEAYTYLKTNSDEKTHSENIILVKILQKIFDKIVLRSGRAEGLSRGGESYPRIHLLEVIDPTNEIWILRSEHFHLTKSPCVHNGIQYKKKVNYFLNYLGLWDRNEQLHFADVNLLHSIGHALDRLYCGHHGHILGQGNLTPQNIFTQIKQIFRIFLQLKLRRGDPPICNVIPLENTNENFVDLFFYICMNDQESIHIKLNKMSIDTLKTLYLPDNIKSMNKQTIIDYIKRQIALMFSQDLHDRFPFYNYRMAYDDTGPNILSILPDCKIKKKYGCKQTINPGTQDFLRETQ